VLPSLQSVSVSVSVSFYYCSSALQISRSVGRSGRRSVGTVEESICLSVCHLSGIMSFVLHPSSASRMSPWRLEMAIRDYYTRRLNPPSLPHERGSAAAAAAAAA
jgi:hypothetical protein